MPAFDQDSLTKLGFFSRLSAETREEIAESFLVTSHTAGEIIQVEGEDCHHVCFIFKGAVRIFRSTPNGREQVLQNLGPGMQFNAIPAITGQTVLKATARALTNVTLLKLPVDGYRNLIQTRTDFASAAAMDFAKRLEHMTALVEDLSLRSVRSRLAKFLLEQADNQAVSAQWTQDEIASRLGTVRDVIGRTLRGFTDAGLIRRDGSWLLLLNRAGLEEEANS